MGVKLAAASGGSIELVPTNTASAFTVTVPAVTGTMALQNGAGVGKVLQVIQATSSTQVINNTTSYVSTGLTASITPSSASSKILVIVQLPVVYGSQNFIIGATRIKRGSTAVLDNTFGNSVSGIVQQYANMNLSYLDSPATTSSTTYTIEFARNSTASPFGNFMVMDQSSGVSTGVILLQEIAG